MRAKTIRSVARERGFLAGLCVFDQLAYGHFPGFLDEHPWTILAGYYSLAGF